jgi:hypothetical protein
LRYDAAPGEWIGVLVELTRDTHNACEPSVHIGQNGNQAVATIQWPDGALTGVPMLAPSHP